jgi:lipopolysaccharide/colanic/teichoic acid biosynthesis glycosyltransferase
MSANFQSHHTVLPQDRQGKIVYSSCRVGASFERFRVRVMRCTACGAELILTNVVPDDTGTVRGFEHHTFICSACHVTERRVIFTRHGGDDDTQAVPLHAAFDCACRSLHDIGQLNNAVKEVIAKQIVELARDGERDPNKLCEHALQTLGFFLGGDVRAKWTSDRAPLTRKEIVAKRVLDLLIAGAALVLLWPLLALICLGIKLEGRSPSILQHRRAAFSGREFAVYNFTTTAWEAACIGQARRNDSRVTRVGRLLKATGMDELPQLFSVLGGRMSLVGPRPDAIDPKGEFGDPIARYATHHHLKPGIIGWAQINRLPRAAAQVEQLNQRIDFERWYIHNWSIWLDLRILLRAVVGPFELAVST